VQPDALGWAVQLAVDDQALAAVLDEDRIAGGLAGLEEVQVLDVNAGKPGGG
jgi:hypothetical protein